MTQRIAVVHATRASIGPIVDSFRRLWPEAQPVNIRDESLLIDRQAAGRLTPALNERIAALAKHGAGIGGKAILFSCSAFGPAIEAAKDLVHVPVFRPYEGMIAAALKRGRDFGILATFQPTIDELTGELEAAARAKGLKISVRGHLAQGALQALSHGKQDEHDRLVAGAAGTLPEVEALLLGQYSMAPAMARIAELPGRTVLSSPDCAVEAVRAALEG